MQSVFSSAAPMRFEIISEFSALETIARGCAIREIASLRDRFGVGRWRKRKGDATVVLENGDVRWAELHWYEAHGIGRVRMKIKRYLD